MDSGHETVVGVDVGGTFTDVVLVTADEVTTAKVPTSDDQSDGVLSGIQAACERAGIDPASIDTFRHAMTVATNAMLEGTGAKTALVTTDGFGDVLEIGRQDRPALYDQSVRPPDPLVPAPRRHELPERTTPDGVEQAVDPAAIDALVTGLDDPDSVAVSLLHAYSDSTNEQAVTEQLRAELDVPVVPSHETLAEFREYERTATTVVDAYVTPVIRTYLDRVAQQATAADIPPPQVMQSNGGIAQRSVLRDHAVTTVLSGPAAGVVGASLFDTGEGVVTFDMGGTSSDVGLVRDGDVERTSEATVAGHPVHVPMVDVETVGAGGGSIAWVDDGGALRVGPASAGADPGPACYGHGGDRPTVTDANLLLGYLGAETELGEGLTLDESAASRVVDTVATEAGLDDAVTAARGIYEVANARMARTIRTVTVERGYDSRAFTLVAFGGAGPMHAAELADRLGIETVRVPRASGVLSALGLLAADERHDASRTHRTRLDRADETQLEDLYDALTEETRTASSAPEAATTDRLADLRYAGQSYELTVSVPDTVDAATLRERFHEHHERVRGYRLPDEAVELVTLRVTTTVPGEPPDITHQGETTAPVGHREALFDGAFCETPVYDRTILEAGTAVEGPALFEGGESTVVVPPDWRATLDDRGTLDLAATADTNTGGNA
jgi:N-methylhydantoinase A